MFPNVYFIRGSGGLLPLTLANKTSLRMMLTIENVDLHPMAAMAAASVGIRLEGATRTVNTVRSITTFGTLKYLEKCP